MKKRTDMGRLRFISSATAEQVQEIFHIQFLDCQEYETPKLPALRRAIDAVWDEEERR